MSVPTIIPSQYSIGEIAPLPDRPEPPQPKIEYLDHAGVEKELDISSDQLDRVFTSPLGSSLGFPAASRKTNFVGRSTLSWRRDAVIAWRDRLVDEIEALGLTEYIATRQRKRERR